MKKYPSLQSISMKSPVPKRQSWEQQLAIAKMWSARNRGKIGRKAN
jgi:hypothetical protein